VKPKAKGERPPRVAREFEKIRIKKIERGRQVANSSTWKHHHRSLLRFMGDGRKSDRDARRPPAISFNIGRGLDYSCARRHRTTRKADCGAAPRRTGDRCTTCSTRTTGFATPARRRVRTSARAHAVQRRGNWSGIRPTRERASISSGSPICTCRDPDRPRPSANQLSVSRRSGARVFVRQCFEVRPQRPRTTGSPLPQQNSGNRRVQSRHDRPSRLPITVAGAAGGRALATVLADGATLPARDTVDARIVESVRRRAGRHRQETDLRESDDGRIIVRCHAGRLRPRRRFWETQFGLDAECRRRSRIGCRGYANIEHYFNNTDPRAVDTRNARNAKPVVISACCRARGGGATRRRMARDARRQFDATSDRAVSITGDATPGHDYAVPGLVTIPAGAHSAPIVLTPLGAAVADNGGCHAGDGRR
jgi:hypothetical protein